ncbi:MAG: N-6 DNA methylase [Cyclobacteriaceae bacterium]|nr:N-6 DNA methylase [Cyclobacteriaceae bacterium]
MGKPNLLEEFVDYCQRHIKGDEKGEAQIFMDRFFTALGYPEGLKGAGAECEFRVRDTKKKTTNFGDLVWKKRVLIEMKKKDENLAIHLQQATDYWFKLAGDRPQYIILCNFDEFWIYDFNVKVFDPVDVVTLADLPSRREAFGFMLPSPVTPVFGKDKEDVTEKAAQQVAAMFRSMIKRRVKSEEALHYALQCIVSLFAEDVGLLPDKIFSRIIEECIQKKASPYDLIGGLFNEMNKPGITPAGYYKGVDYFNGGLFKEIKAIELTAYEIDMLEGSANKNWRHVNPAIFGSFFEGNLDKELRHELGAHYTHEIDIKKIVNPVIVQPWMQRIEEADTIDDYFLLLTELTQFKVLDPACGSGNFLFVAFREMKLLERKLFALIFENTKKTDKNKLDKFLTHYPFVNTQQFYGIDLNPTAVEIAKVTLMVAKELSILEKDHSYDNKFSPLPLDNLDENIVCTDALLNDDGTQRQWPEVDAIIGNPPFQSKNKMQQEFGVEYMNKLRLAYAEVPGRADFCVYWFYKAHKQLKPNAFAGLVGTNTIRQNYSREGSLDYIVHHGGEIFNAVSSQDWSGDAAVFVSIANWKKGKYDGDKVLYFYDGKELKSEKQPIINSSLSLETDVTEARVLETNKKPKRVFQGQTHGHEGFLLEKNDALKILKKHPKYAEVLKPFLIGDELVAALGAQPSRFVIDFTLMDVMKAATYKELFQRVETMVLPDRKEKGEAQEKENKKALKANAKVKVNKHHVNFLNNWWKLSYGRGDMLENISTLKCFVSCSRVTSRPIFEFLDSNINPNDALMVFAFDDYYSFGVIDSKLHWQWFEEKCSTMKGDSRYTADTVWDTFPWPQNPTQKQVEKVAEAAMKLHHERTKTLKEHNMSLRDLYRLLEQPGKNPIKDLHTALDKAVMEAYGFDEKKDLLSQLLALNLQVAAKEEQKEKVQAPGWPQGIKGKEKFVTDDCVKFEG